MGKFDPDDIQRRVLAIVGSEDDQIPATDFAKHYHESFRQSGITKADSIIRDLKENRPYVRLSDCAYFSIGGSTGDEVEHVLRNTDFKFGLLLEYDNTAAEIALKKSSEIKNDIGKTLSVVTGDATQKISECKKRLLEWKNRYDINGLVASAQAVLHELPMRSPGFKMVHFLGEVLWEWEPCLFYSREPCSPREWPEIVRLSVSNLSSELLEKLAIYVGRFLNIKGEVHRAGPQEILLPSILAVEVLHKLFYIEDFSHEIGERLTSVDSEELVEVLESYLGVGSVQRTHLNTNSFTRLYNEFGVEAKDERGSKRLSPPLAFVGIVGERRSSSEPARSDDSSEIDEKPIVYKRVQASSSENVKVILDEYLNKVYLWANQISGHFWDRSESTQVKTLTLNDVHVPLDTRERVATCEDTDGIIHRILPREIETKGVEIDCVENWRLVQMLAFEAIPHYSRIILVGRAGVGKTTTLRYIASQLSHQMIKPSEVVVTQFTLYGWKSELPIPVRLTLKENANERSSTEKNWHLSSELQGSDKLAEILNEYAEAGRILFLIDNIDSIPKSSQASVDRDANELLTKYPDCLWLLTAQSLNWGYEKSALAQWFRPISIAPLLPDKKQEMIKAYWTALSEQKPQDEIDAIVTGIESAIDRFGLGDLSSSPEILSCLISIYALNEKGLPHSRLELYNSIINILESRWEDHTQTSPKTKSSDSHNISKPETLADIPTKVASITAYNALRDGTKPGRPFPPALLYSACKDYGPRELAARGVLTQFIESESGLLRRTSEEELIFSNRGIQEFLAACEMRGRTNFPSIGSDLVQSDHSRWKNVFIMASGLSGPDSGIAAVRALCPYKPPSEDGKILVDDDMWRRAWMSGEALVEIGIESVKARPERIETLEHIQAWLVCLIENGALSTHERHEVGIVLSRVGDPRLGVCTEALDLCLVQKGPVMLGGDGLTETPPYEFDIPYDFFVSKYPVTNAQYAQYLDDQPEAKLPDDEANVWSNLRRVPEPGYANHPVTGVTYLSAKAYCDWLTTRLRDRNELPDGYVANLPTEAEWMKAYRGGVKLSDGAINPAPIRRFPWGMEWSHGRANLPEDKSALSQTTSVGIYPTGVTPIGIFDAAGNILEWTSTCWGSYDPAKAGFDHPYDPKDGREDPDAKGLRIVRGGSWLFSEGAAKCACRLDPGRAFPDTGFRVFLVPKSD